MAMPLKTEQMIAGLIEFLRILDWFTELAKILFNKPAGDFIYGWVVLTMIGASFVLAQRIFDQIALLLSAQNWAQSSRMCLICLTFPLSLPLMPFSFVSFHVFGMRPDADKDRTIFAGRPLSTILMGLPIYNVISTFATNVAVAMHPLQSHLRVMQGLLQTLCEDIPCFFIDMAVLINNRQLDDPHPDRFFVISAGYSCFLMFATMVWNIREVNRFETPEDQQKLAAPGAKPPQAIRDGRP